jgi:hypothetical protein
MSNDVQIPMADRVRSLERSEAQVLYGRCHGLTHGEIAAKYEKTSDTWSRNLMTRVFEKVGSQKTDSRNKKNEFLKTQVCPVLDEILQRDEANLERWPLYGWVVVSREGDSAVYREREDHERLYLDARDDVPQVDDHELPFANGDEEDELKPREWGEIEEIEEKQEKPGERVSQEHIPPPTEPGVSSPLCKRKRN